MIYSATNQALHPDELRTASNQLGRVIEYLRDNPTTRVCVQYNSKDSIDVLENELSKLSLVTTNYTVSTKAFSQLREMLHRNIPAYLDFPVTDWETFSNLADWGVTDILIDGPLGFQMEQLSKRKENIKIRVRPHASVNASLSMDDNENSFFIRPEDIDTYSPFVDIIEIFCENKETEETVFNIYKRKSFNSDLSLLIKQLNYSVNNPLIMPDFVQYRLNCGQVCKRSPGRCQMCKNVLDMTNFVVKAFKDTKKETN